MQHIPLVLVFSRLVGSGLFFSVIACAQSTPVGELFPLEVNSSDPALQAGSGIPVTSGSQLSVGEFSALVKLNRGGQIRLCPQTSVSVSASQGGDGILFSMNTGTVVINYTLLNLADTLVTPDFRILLAGPGTFHVNLGVTSRGDTCVKPMPDNNSRMIISEMFGTGTYQVKENESVVFAGGKLSGMAPLTTACGCPSQPSVQSASGQAPDTPALPATQVRQDRAAIDMPFVFSAQAASPPYSVAKVEYSSLPDVFSLQEKVKPVVSEESPAEVSGKPANAEEPPAEKKEKKKKKGFFGRVFGAVFGR